MKNKPDCLKETANIDALLVQLSANPYFDLLSSYVIGQLGLYYLAEYADKVGYNVKVKYYNSFERVSELLPELIKRFSCSIVGFYVDSDNVWALRNLIPLLQKSYPKLHIILGGPQVTGDPIGTLKLVPGVSCGVIGEGEIPFLRLLQASDWDDDVLSKIDGLVYLNPKNQLIINKPQRQCTNIDEYRFPRREKYCLDPDRITFPQLVTGRGCMGRCAFCYEGNREHANLRVRSLESCLEEIDYLVQTYHIKYINIVDDTFILNKRRTEDFCNRLIDKYQGNLKWYCEARVDVLAKNIDVLPLLKQAGLIKIQLGGESGCQEILDAYNKGITVEELEYVTRKIADVGIPYIYINFIIGGAFETESTFDRTLSFAKKLMRIAPGCVEVTSSVFTPTPGSPMYIHPEKYGLRIIDKRTIRGASCSFVYAETKQLSQFKIWQLRNKFNNEISKEYVNLIDVIPIKQLKNIFNLSVHYAIETSWSELLKRRVNYRNYYEPLAKGCFYSFCDIPEDEILRAIPLRTAHLNSDGVGYYRMSKSGKYVKNGDLENALITLSAGKLSFQEILDIVKSNTIFTDRYADIYNECISIYKNFDDDLSVVWRRI